MTIKQVAEAFAAGREAKCHNASTDGNSYLLHGKQIAYKSGGYIIADWCGYYTVTTANHLSKIAAAIGSPFPVSRKYHQDNQVSTFNLDKRVI